MCSEQRSRLMDNNDWMSDAMLKWVYRRPMQDENGCEGHADCAFPGVQILRNHSEMVRNDAWRVQSTGQIRLRRRSVKYIEKIRNWLCLLLNWRSVLQSRLLHPPSSASNVRLQSWRPCLLQHAILCSLQDLSRCLASQHSLTGCAHSCWQSGDERQRQEDRKDVELSVVALLSSITAHSSLQLCVIGAFRIARCAYALCQTVRSSPAASDLSASEAPTLRGNKKKHKQ